MSQRPYRMQRAVREYARTITTSEATYGIEMGGTMDGFGSVHYVETYGGHMREAVRFEPNDFLVIENVGDVDLVNPRIVVNGRRDWHSADAILAGILEPGMSDEEKALAIWGHCSSISVQAHENDLRVGPPGPDQSANPSANTFGERGDPVKAANCYYCSGCQYSAANLVVLLRHAGLEARAVWIAPRTEPHQVHCQVEVLYGGKYHLLDPEIGCFYLTADNLDIASYEEVSQNPDLFLRTHHCRFANPGKLGDEKGYRFDTYYPPLEMPADRWLSSMALTLRPGERLVRRWDHIGKYRHGLSTRHKPGYPPPHRLANGKLIYEPDLAQPLYRKGALGHLNVSSTWEDGVDPALHPHVAGEPAHVIFKVESPYPIVGGLVGGSFRRATSDDSARILLSIRNSPWTVIWSADEMGAFDTYAPIDRWIDALNTPASRSYYLKYEFGAACASEDAGLDAVYIETDLEMASTSLPALSVGANRIEYRDDTAGPHAARLWHGWHESSEARPPSSPGAPILPTDGAALAMDAPSELAWNPAETPEGEEIAAYHVQVSPWPNMLAPVSPNLDRITYSAEPRWTLPQGWLAPGRRYYWRVRAQTTWGLWSGWSDVWSFQIAGLIESHDERSGTT
jgi:hypothetical protein